MERKNSAKLKDKRRLFSLFAAEQNELRALFQECRELQTFRVEKDFQVYSVSPSPVMAESPPHDHQISVPTAPGSDNHCLWRQLIPIAIHLINKC